MAPIYARTTIHGKRAEISTGKSMIVEKWIDHDPFVGFKITPVEVNKEFLTKEEIAKIYEKELGFTRLAQVRDIFIFCCYTGLSFVDVQKLTAADIQKGLDGELWIMINRKKTGTQSHIPLLPEAKTYC